MLDVRLRTRLQAPRPARARDEVVVLAELLPGRQLEALIGMGGKLLAVSHDHYVCARLNQGYLAKEEDDHQQQHRVSF